MTEAIDPPSTPPGIARFDRPVDVREARSAVDAALSALDSGTARIAEKVGGDWVVHQWLKKAVLLSFRLNPMEMIPGGPGGAHWWDKVPSKFAGWSEKQFEAAGFRAVPGAIVRRGAFIAPARADAELRQHRRPSRRRNHGRHWATVGSCAQIGRMSHLGREGNRRSARAAPAGR